MDDADGDGDRGGDGADGFTAFAADQDAGALVGVHDGPAAADPPAATRRLQAVLGVADMVPASIL
ncbi:hypothetical protein ABT158_39270 [Nonomuraea sp. NPDC001636]|uniref:hypothetical protein n=1 Tax=Nonomuraea sp. NPDC001636 TaxID=3154391 RepID=UPI003322D8CA